MIISCYNIINESEILSSERHLDDKGRVLFDYDYSQKPEYIRKYKYNDKGLLILEKLFQANLELNATKYHYNDEGEENGTSYYVTGELYEQIIFKRVGEKIVKTTYRENVEVLRIEHENDGDNSTIKFYTETVLDETRIINFNEEENTTRERSFSNDKLFHTLIEKSNKDGFLIRREIYVGDGVLQSAIDIELQNNLVTRVKQRHFSGFETDHDVFNKHDLNGNRIHTEYKTPEGGLIGFSFWNFNDKGQLIEEYGDIINDDISGNQNYHSLYKYTTQK